MNSTKPKKCKNNIESSNNIAKKLKSHTNCADNVILKTNIMLLSWIKTMLVIKIFAQYYMPGRQTHFEHSREQFLWVIYLWRYGKWHI